MLTVLPANFGSIFQLILCPCESTERWNMLMLHWNQKNSQWMNVSDFKLFIDNPPPKNKNKSRDFNRSNSPFQKDCFFLEGRKVEHVETLLILILIHLDYHNLSLVKNNLVKWITTSIWRYLAGISTWHLMKVVPQKLIVACCLRMETVSWYFHILASLINKRNPSKKKTFRCLVTCKTLNKRCRTVL